MTLAKRTALRPPQSAVKVMIVVVNPPGAHECKGSLFDPDGARATKTRMFRTLLLEDIPVHSVRDRQDCKRELIEACHKYTGFGEKAEVDIVLNRSRNTTHAIIELETMVGADKVRCAADRSRGPMVACRAGLPRADESCVLRRREEVGAGGSAGATAMMLCVCPQPEGAKCGGAAPEHLRGESE